MPMRAFDKDAIRYIYIYSEKKKKKKEEEEVVVVVVVVEAHLVQTSKRANAQTNKHYIGKSVIE